METICIHYKINDRTFRRWVNQYPTVRQYYNEALTTLKETKAEKMGILAITGQEKLLKGAEYITTRIDETFDNDGNRTGYTKRTFIRQLPPNVQMVKFTLSNYDKKHCQLKPWGDDKHDNNSWINKEREPSILFREAEDFRETQEFKEFLKWKENNNLENARDALTSPIIDKESADIMVDTSDNNQLMPKGNLALTHYPPSPAGSPEAKPGAPCFIPDFEREEQLCTNQMLPDDLVIPDKLSKCQNNDSITDYIEPHPHKTADAWQQATPQPIEDTPPLPEEERYNYVESSFKGPEWDNFNKIDTLSLEMIEALNRTENDKEARLEVWRNHWRQKHIDFIAEMQKQQTEKKYTSPPKPQNDESERLE